MSFPSDLFGTSNDMAGLLEMRLPTRVAQSPRLHRHNGTSLDILTMTCSGSCDRQEMQIVTVAVIS